MLKLIINGLFALPYLPTRGKCECFSERTLNYELSG